MCDSLNLTFKVLISHSSPVSLSECVQKYLDLTSIPKRSFFELFWHFGEDTLEKERLREFSTTAGQEDLVDYVIRPRRTVLEVFADFPHTTANVPLAYLFDLIPPILPTLAIVNFRTKLKRPRRGLCTTFLASLDPCNQPRCNNWHKEG
ncbi:hypothetical protein MTO96_010844 [Rhipicephalus appendiculatus]